MYLVISLKIIPPDNTILYSRKTKYFLEQSKPIWILISYNLFRKKNLIISYSFQYYVYFYKTIWFLRIDLYNHLPHIIVMPIKQNIDPDMLMGITYGAYCKAIGSGDWRRGVHLVRLMNAGLTPAFQIKDLPKFEVPNTIDGDTYFMKYAMEYCEEYSVKVLEAFSIERATLYQNYKDAD